MDLYKKLAICKFDLIKILLNKKKMRSEDAKELRKYLLLIDTLMKKLKEKQNVNYKENVNQIEEYIQKII